MFTTTASAPRRAGCPGDIFAAIVMLVFAFPTASAQTGQATASQADASNTTVILPAGSRFMVRMIDQVDSDNSQPNQRFRGSLEANLMAGDVVAAPVGTTVFGRILVAGSSGRRAGGELEFDLTDIVLNGHTYSLATTSKQLQGEGGSSGAGTGSKAGAAIGGITGGLGGALRGATVGAVAGHASSGNTRGDKVKVPAGSLVEFTLQHPVSLPAAR